MYVDPKFLLIPPSDLITSFHGKCIYLCLYPACLIYNLFCPCFACPLFNCCLVLIHVNLPRAYFVLLSHPSPLLTKTWFLYFCLHSTPSPAPSLLLLPMKILQGFMDWLKRTSTRSFTCLPPLSLEEMSLLFLCGKSSTVWR